MASAAERQTPHPHTILLGLGRGAVGNTPRRPQNSCPFCVSDCQLGHSFAANEPLAGFRATTGGFV